AKPAFCSANLNSLVPGSHSSFCPTIM
ncbi:hypothetical protein VCHENC02_4113B, partial [Vibrio harveyi]